MLKVTPFAVLRPVQYIPSVSPPTSLNFFGESTLSQMPPKVNLLKFCSFRCFPTHSRISAKQLKPPLTPSAPGPLGALLGHQLVHRQKKSQHQKPRRPSPRPQNRAGYLSYKHFLANSFLTGAIYIARARRPRMGVKVIRCVCTKSSKDHH